MTSNIACPKCGGNLEWEGSALIRAKVNPKTGRIGKAYIYDSSGNGTLDTLRCETCRIGYDFTSLSVKRNGKHVDVVTQVGEVLDDE